MKTLRAKNGNKVNEWGVGKKKQNHKNENGISYHYRN